MTITMMERGVLGGVRRLRWPAVGLVGAGLVSVGSVSSAVSAHAAPPEAGTVFIAERAAADKWLVDDRDAGLARAIGMLPARMRELPRDSPEFAGLTPGVLNFMIAAASRPARVGITYNPQDPTGGGFGMGLVVSVEAEGRDEAASMQGTVSGLLAARGAPFEFAPSELYETMSETFTPFGMLRYGPRAAEGDRWRWEIHFGSLGNPDAPFAGLPGAGALGEGFAPFLRASLDPAPLAPLLNMLGMFAAGQPGAQEGIKQLVESGLMGPEAIKYDYQMGYLPDRSVSAWTMRGARRYAPKLGLSTEPLAESALAAIPADATVAGAMRFDAGQLVGALRAGMEAEPEGADLLGQFREHTGVDLLDDVVASLGDTVGVYLSDSTGGGDIGSAVMFVTLSNAEKFRTANTRLTAAANAALGENPDLQGRVRGRQWEEGGTTFYTLSFPGLPVPLEPTYAVAGNMVVMGLTPQAAVVAARQASGRGDKGLGSNAAFSAAMPRGRRVTSVMFVDTARTMRSGYQYVSLMGSALANAVRSPVDPARDPGMVVPTFAELREGARARLTYSYWDGEDLVRVTEGNRSMLVEAAGVIGAAEPLFPVIGAVIGGAGAAMQERERGR